MNQVLSDIFKTLRGLLFLPLWHLQRFRRRDPNVWVFGAWSGQRYSDNARALFEYVVAHYPSINAVWITRSQSVYDRLIAAGLPVAMAGSRDGIRWCRCAGVACINNWTDDFNERYLNGAYHVWLWHGMPLKQIFEDERRFLRRRYSFFKKLKMAVNSFVFPYEQRPPIDSVLETSDFFTPFFQSACCVPPQQIWDDGYPRNDALLQEGEEDIVRRYRQQYPDATFVVYMPTHRHHALGTTPFNAFNDFGFDRDAFFSTLERGNYVFFNKGHFIDSAATVTLSHPRFLNVTDDDYDNLYSFLRSMDVLITDFSSVYFDYLLLRRPILLASFDYEGYVNDERPLYFDYSTWRAPRADTWPELLTLLEDHAFTPPSDDEIQLFHTHPDADSCQRVAQHILKEVFR